MKKRAQSKKLATASRRTSAPKAGSVLPTSHWKWIRVKRAFPLPAYVKQALQRLDEAGHVAYVVGGSVRDFLLQREPKDHDIATDAGPEELCAIFENAITVGKAFGVLKVPVGAGEGAKLLEIATFREDLEYKDFRRPEAVRFAGPLEDAMRRDFTINALFYDPKNSRILDATNGFEDLKAGIVRAIGDPDARFREDALRLLRAARFAAQLGFALDPATESAIKARGKLIFHVSGERIRDELTLMLQGPRPALAIGILAQTGLLKGVLPEVEAMRGVIQAPTYFSGTGEASVLETTLKTQATLARKHPKRSAALAWAALLYDVGKPVAIRRSEGRNFNAHELDGSLLARSICLRFKMPRAEMDAIASMVEDLIKFHDVFKMREATLARFVRLPYFEELLALHQAQAISLDGNLAYYEFCAHRLAELRGSLELAPPRLIDGTDLIQLGFQPGPEFSEILRDVEDLALEKRLVSKEQALEYVVSKFVK